MEILRILEILGIFEFFGIFENFEIFESFDFFEISKLSKLMPLWCSMSQLPRQPAATSGFKRQWASKGREPLRAVRL